MKNKDIPKKKNGCLYRFAVLLFALALLALIKEVNDSSKPTNSVENTISPLQTTLSPVATETPSTPGEYVTQAAKEIYKDNLISVDFVDVDKESPMLEVYCVFQDGFSNESRRDIFMDNASDFLHKVSVLLEDKKIDFESVFIHARTTFVDKYGNEFDGDAMQIRIYATELQKINWDNILKVDLEDLAVAFAVHPLFRD